MAIVVERVQSYTLIKGKMSATFIVRANTVTLTHRTKWATTVRTLTTAAARERYRALLREGYERF